MRKEKPCILVVDDEPKYVWLAKVNLEAREYEVLTAHTGEEAIDLAARQEPDLILLDIKMPGMDGYQVCQRIREFSTVPIIMLTAMAEDADKIKGLDLGADDYVTKPFSIPELVARVRAVLRRAEEAKPSKQPAIFQAGRLLVDFTWQRVFFEDEEVGLTPTEYRLLCELVQHTGRVLVPSHLLEKAWGPEYADEDHLVRKVIYRLRQKIEPEPGNPRYILTKPGIGYYFDNPE
jgi:DNA-binding response OmpR family regulator